MKITREELKTILETNQRVCVVYLKKNNQKRTLVCTLHPDMFPYEAKGTGHGRPLATNMLRAKDYENNGDWRIITIEKVNPDTGQYEDRIISVTIMEPLTEE